MRRVRGPRAAALLAVAIAGCLAVACGGQEDEDGFRAGPSPSAHASGVDLSDADLWLSFEEQTTDYDGVPAYPAASGGWAGRVVTSHDGRVEEVPGADGSAVALEFPPRCAAAVGCPHAMLEVPASSALDPGEEEFEYGATVWLAPDQTAPGSNVVQKGRFGSAGGQWKLQVDGTAGEPSCVVRSGTTMLVVHSEVTVADSSWHHVSCRRDDDGVSIRVDGTVDRASGRLGSVSSPWPVRVGSPGVGDQDDQFHGRIDDVYVRIGP